jgi:hypothetical protein
MAAVAEKFAMGVATPARANALGVLAGDLFAPASAYDLIAKALKIPHVLVAHAFLGQNAACARRGRF